MSTIDLLVNHGIPTGWTDALPWLNLTNQQPHGFHTHISVPGEELDSADSYTGPDDAPVVTTATVVPECVHIHKSQLPADEQPGAENALILEGEWVYKVFASAGAFSHDIYAWALAPADGVLYINVPVQVHYNPNPGGDGSPGAAVWRLRVDDDIFYWNTFGDGFADRLWEWTGNRYRVTAGEVVTIRLQLESRSEAGIDFFTDLEAWRADFTPDDEPPPIPEPEPCRGAPRGQYTRVVNVIPADATPERFLDIAEIAWDAGRQTVTGSYDDAGIGDLGDRTAVLWDIPADERHDYGVFFDAYYPGVEVIFKGDGAPTPDPEPDPPPDPEPDPPPDPAWKPHNYVPTGTLLGFHAAGDGGQTGDVFAPLTPLGAQPPTSKVIVSLGAARDIKAIDPSVITIGRIIDAPGYGNVEGFDYGGDPEAQAHWHMAAIMQQFGPHLEWYDYIEVINEQGPPTPAYHVKLAQFFLHCMTIANTWGMKLALFSHSVGTPEPADWDAIADTGIFEAAARWGHCIALHEYNLSSTGGCLYRYRDLYNRIILPKQLDIPLYITEYNVDVAFAFNADVMFANWTAYDTELARDPYVAGVHIYSTGEVYSSYRPTIYSLWDRYRGYAISVKDRINA